KFKCSTFHVVPAALRDPNDRARGLLLKSGARLNSNAFAMFSSYTIRPPSLQACFRRAALVRSSEFECLRNVSSYQQSANRGFKADFGEQRASDETPSGLALTPECRASPA